MRVQLRGDDFCGGIARGHGRGLSSRCGAAIQQARARADQRGDQLRCFILDEDAAFLHRLAC